MFLFPEFYGKLFLLNLEKKKVCISVPVHVCEQEEYHTFIWPVYLLAVPDFSFITNLGPTTSVLIPRKWYFSLPNQNIFTLWSFAYLLLLNSRAESPGSIPTVALYFCPSARRFIHIAALNPGL